MIPNISLLCFHNEGIAKLIIKSSWTGSSPGGDGMGKTKFTLSEAVHLSLKEGIARFIPNITHRLD